MTQHKAIDGREVTVIEYAIQTSKSRWELVVINRGQFGTWYWSSAAFDENRELEVESQSQEKIELVDSGRQIRLVCNLVQRQVETWKNGTLDDTCVILKWQDEAKGWCLNRIVATSSETGRVSHFLNTGAKSWAEVYPDQRRIRYFQESMRDENSVHLVRPGQDEGLRIDLFKNGIYGGPNRDQKLYSIANPAYGVCGWTVDGIRCETESIDGLSTFRQVSPRLWEFQFPQSDTQPYTYLERFRDEWSVYLLDRPTGHQVQIDLYRKKVSVTEPGKDKVDLFDIRESDSTGRFWVRTLDHLDWVEVADQDGSAVGTIVRNGPNHWILNRGGEYYFKEQSRDGSTLYLKDVLGSELEIDIHTQESLYRKGSKQESLRIVRWGKETNGFTVNRVSCGEHAKETQVFEQIGTLWWRMTSPDGTGDPIFLERTHRDEWSVYLSTRDRDPTLPAAAQTPIRYQLDLYQGALLIRDRNKTLLRTEKLYKRGRGPEPWRNPQPITSRTALTEEYEVNPSTRKREAHPVFRSSITFPHPTVWVDLWASAATDVVVDGNELQLSPSKPVRVTPSTLSRLVVTIPAEDLHCPKLYLNTNLMSAEHQHVVIPEVEAHKKIVAMPDGELQRNRAKLGINTNLTPEHVDHLQNSLQNVARSVQYSYNRTPHGIHHDRAIHPANMQDPHFKIDFGSGGIRYTPLEKREVHRHIEGARPLARPRSGSFWDILGHYFEEATHVVVHTAENVVHDVIETVDHVARDVAQTVEKVGEDLVHGDILDAGADLISGGEHVGTDLIHGGQSVAGDVMKGAGQLLTVTIKTGKELVQFAIEHTGIVGKVLGWLLQKAGAEMGKVVRHLLDKIGWEEVLETHDWIYQMIDNEFETMVDYVNDLRNQSDAYFQNLEEGIDEGTRWALDQLGVKSFAEQPEPIEGQSAAIEKMEWLLGKLFQFFEDSPAVAIAGGGGIGSAFDAFAQFAETELEEDGDFLRLHFEELLRVLRSIFSEPPKSTQEFLGRMLEVVRGVALLSLRIISKVLDLLLDFIADVLRDIKQALAEPQSIPFLSDFYEGLTGRRFSYLSAFSLLVAVPTRMILDLIEAVQRPAPGAVRRRSAIPPQQRPQTNERGREDGARNAYVAYGAVHLLMSALEPGWMLYTFAIVDYNTPSGGNRTHDVEFDVGATYTSGMLLVFGIFAQALARPLPIGVSREEAGSSSLGDLFEAPDKLSWITWEYQWAGVVLSLLGYLMSGASLKGKHLKERNKPSKLFDSLGEVGGDIMCLLTGWYGIAHAGLMIGIAAHDQRKVFTLDILFGDAAIDENDVGSARLKQGRDAAKALRMFFWDYFIDSDPNTISPWPNFIDGKEVWPDDNPDLRGIHLAEFRFQQWIDRYFYAHDAVDKDNSGKLLPVPDNPSIPLGAMLHKAHDLRSVSEAIAAQIPNHTKNAEGQRYKNDRAAMEWAWHCYLYWLWGTKATIAGGNAIKGTGNFFDAVPEIAQFFAIPTLVEESEGASLAVAVEFDAISHLIEAGIVLARASRRTLY